MGKLSDQANPLSSLPRRGNLTASAGTPSLLSGSGGRSSAWLEPQIVDLAVAGSNPVDHPTYAWRNG